MNLRQNTNNITHTPYPFAISFHSMDIGHKSYTFTAPPFELPLAARSNRLKPSISSSRSELDSPHIHVGLKSSTNYHGSQSDMSTGSGSEAAIDEVTQHYLMQPHLGRRTSFEEFRMPPFSSLVHLDKEDLSQTDVREFPASTFLSRTPPPTTYFPSRPHTTMTTATSSTTTRPRTVSLDTAMLSASHSANTNNAGRFHQTRFRNKAMDSRQFDDILDQVFIIE
jgi:hypothetical protein